MKEFPYAAHVYLIFNAELCGNFGAAQQWKNCPATAACYMC